MPNWKKVITSGSDASLNSLYVSSSLTASGNIFPTDLGVDRQVLKTDGLGNLTFGYPEEIVAIVKNVSGGTLQKGLPVHATASGASGNVVGIIAASASLATSMPATFILNETLADEAEGEALAAGFIQGVNTSGFEVGQVVYVGANGGYTGIKPTGSNLIQNLGIVTKIDATNGSGYILGTGRSNDVPNLAPGNVLVGNPDSVPTAVLTSSLSVASAVSSTNATNATNIGVDSVGAEEVYLLLAESETGTQGAKTDSDLTYNASTNVLSVTSSYAVTSSHALTASYIDGIIDGIFIQTGSIYATTNDLEVTGSLDITGYLTAAGGIFSSEGSEGYLEITQSGDATVEFKNQPSGSFFTVTQGNAMTLTGSTLDIDASTTIYSSGSTVFNVEGSQGQLFSITDNLSGSLFSVNDISGIPILEVFSDNTVKIGTYNSEGIIVTDGNVEMSASLNVSGSATLSDKLTVTGNFISTFTSGSDVKYGLWGSDVRYGIGMQPSVTLGALNDYAMTFCMNDDADRGFWWGYEGQAKSAGAMSLTTGGKLKVTTSVAVGTIDPSATVGRIDASNDIVAYSSSDKRWKTNITTIETPLQKLLKLGGYEFDWVEDSKIHGNVGHDVGIIAQEVEEVLPEAVQTRDTGMKAVRYEKLIPLLIETIKEQQQQIDELKTKIQ
jgi:hypothetical protein